MGNLGEFVDPPYRLPYQTPAQGTPNDTPRTFNRRPTTACCLVLSPSARRTASAGTGGMGAGVQLLQVRRVVVRVRAGVDAGSRLQAAGSRQSGSQASFAIICRKAVYQAQESLLSGTGNLC